MSVSTGTSRPDQAATSGTPRLLIAGVIAGPLFIVTLLVQGAVRADYDPLRHPGSSLSLGESGWIQDVNFIVAGVLALLFAAGLSRVPVARPHKRSRWGPLLIAAWAIGLIGAGIFLSDPISGYPPGTPAMTEPASTQGALHDLFSIPGFIALFAACLVYTRRFAAQRRYRWSIYSAATAIVVGTAFGLSGAAFNQTEGLVEFGGLFQRITVITGWAWLTALAIHMLHRVKEPSTVTVDQPDR